MEREMGVSEARRELARVIDDVKYKGENYVIVRRGEPAAAVVPISVYLEWKRKRTRLFETIRDLQAGNTDTDPDDVMTAVLEAQQSLRQSSTK